MYNAHKITDKVAAGKIALGTRRAVNYGIWDKAECVADTDRYVPTVASIISP